MLVVARLIQGVGGALTSAVILGMIVTMFPAPGERAKAIGVFAFVASAGGSIGLLAGGALTTAINWHWIFFVNVPIGVITFILALRTIKHDRGIGLEAGADILGAALITSSLIIGVYAIVTVPDHGWGSPHTLLFGAVAVVLMALFVTRQQRTVNPLMPLRILRSRSVTSANTIQVLMAASTLGAFFLVPLYLERVRGMSALDIGVAFLPTTITVSVFSLGFTERLATRVGPKATLTGGLVIVTASLALFSRVPVHGNYLAGVLPAMLLLGVGLGTAWPSLMSLAMSAATDRDSGLASGLINTSQQIGGALGLAVLATLSATRTNSLLAAGASHGQALTAGYHLAFVIATATIAVAIPVAALAIPRRASTRLPATSATSAHPTAQKAPAET